MPQKIFQHNIIYYLNIKIVLLMKISLTVIYWFCIWRLSPTIWMIEPLWHYWLTWPLPTSRTCWNLANPYFWIKGSATRFSHIWCSNIFQKWKQNEYSNRKKIKKLLWDYNIIMFLSAHQNICRKVAVFIRSDFKTPANFPVLPVADFQEKNKIMIQKIPLNRNIVWTAKTELTYPRFVEDRDALISPY